MASGEWIVGGEVCTIIFEDAFPSGRPRGESNLTHVNHYGTFQYIIQTEAVIPVVLKWAFSPSFVAVSFNGLYY
jgi:hypothetical protein